MLYAEPINKSFIPGWLQVAPIALVMTFSLFFLMERLIAMGDVELDETETPALPDITWEEPAPIETRITPPEKIEEPVQAPEIPQELIPHEAGGEITIPRVPFDATNGVPRNIGMSSSMPLAKLMSSPKYPRNALTRGIEGYVDVRFDISEKGFTENIRVIKASPEGVFEKAAVDAVRKWRFQPSINEGKAERFFGMSKRVVFEMQKG